MDFAEAVTEKPSKQRSDGGRAVEMLRLRELGDYDLDFGDEIWFSRYRASAGLIAQFLLPLEHVQLIKTNANSHSAASRNPESRP